MIAMLLISISLIFYFSLYAYLYLIVNKLKKRTPIKFVLWLLFSFWLLFLILVGMGSIQKYFVSYHKALAIIPILIALLFSAYKDKSLWISFFKSNKG